MDKKICFIRNYIHGDLLEITKFDSEYDIINICGIENELFGLNLLVKIFDEDKLQNIYDYIVLVDEDCKIEDMEVVLEIIEHMGTSDVDICGMPDGDEVYHRAHRNDCPNLFFTVFKCDKIRKWDSEEYENWETPLYEDKPDSTEFEPYYRVITYLIHCLGCLFSGLHGDTLECDNISTVLYHLGKRFCVHTWYTRLYGIDEDHTRRIDGVLSGKTNELYSAELK